MSIDSRKYPVKQEFNADSIKQLLKPKLEAIPPFLHRLSWATWAAKPRGNGKIGKCPVIGGRAAKTNAPETWLPFSEAKREYESTQGGGVPRLGPICGLGILLTEGCGLVGIDIDNAFDAEGNLSDLAQRFLPDLLRYAYCERSPSGHGIRAFLYGQKPGNCRRGNLELYDKDRFLTVTGHRLDGCQNTPANGEKAQSILNELAACLNENKTAAPSLPPPPVNTKPQKTQRRGYGELDDADILKILTRARNSDKFNALFRDGNTSAYSSPSEARLALACILAFYTPDAEQIDRIMRLSALLKTPEQMEKWERLGKSEIAKAQEMQPGRYGCKSEKAKNQQKRGEAGEEDPLFSEDELCRRFEDKYKNVLRYDHDRGCWYGWNSSFWKRDQTKGGFNLIRTTIREISALADDSTARKLQKAATASGVETFAQASRYFAVNSTLWDPDDFLLGTPGGTVDLKTGELRPANPLDFITKSTTVAPAAKNTPSPLWRKFLEEATWGKEGLIDFLQLMTGMCLTGSTREQALFFVYGAGGNGKSVFLNAITEILGQYAATASMDTFTASKTDRHPTELAMLCGPRLVTASETEEGRAWAANKVKAMTGSDPISARFMRRDFFTFLPKFKLLIIGNHKPIIRNVDDALRRRINIIPFTNKPETVDKKLSEKLRPEYPAILRWMIEGCIRWQKNGLQKPECVSAETADYFETQDIFGQWLDECCDQNAQFSDTSAALFSSWKDFAEKSSVHAGSSKSFAEEMRKRGFERTKTRGKRAFRGLTLKAQINQYDTSMRECRDEF